MITTIISTAVAVQGLCMKMLTGMAVGASAEMVREGFHIVYHIIKK